MSGEELKVTDAMNDAWVAYEPVHEYSENMKGHEVIAAIKHAFVSGYSARAHPLPEQPQEEDAAAEIASLKQRLESAEGLLTQWRTWACGQEGASPFQDTRTFLQEQEKQNG